MLANSGPTFDNLPPFDWTKVKIPVNKPLMHPTKWMFQPIITRFIPNSHLTINYLPFEVLNFK